MIKKRKQLFELQGDLNVHVDGFKVRQEVTFSLDDGKQIVLFGSSARVRQVFSQISKALTAEQEKSFSFRAW